MQPENRRYPRHPVSWPVRVWLGEGLFLLGRAIDASTHGLQVVLLSLVPPSVVKLGELYRLEIDADPHGVLTRFGEARNVRPVGVGFAIRDASLPVEVSR
jgi:hypothetical protein